MANRQRLEIATARIPYYRAPFYFAPEYMATAEEWQKTFRRLTENILLQNGCGGKIIDVHTYSITIGWGTLEFSINARLGTFEVWENDGQEDDDPSSDCWGGAEAVPSSFIDEIRSKAIPERLVSSVSGQIIPFANAIFRKMTDGFEKALRQRYAEIQSQPMSPLPTVPFILLEPDHRRYFPLDPKERYLTLSGADELDEATGPNGEKLFSFCVVALHRLTAGKISRAKAVGVSKADGRVRQDRKKIYQMLEEGYASLRSKPSRTKAELIAMVEGQLGDNSPGRTTLYEWVRDLFPDF